VIFLILFFLLGVFSYLKGWVWLVILSSFNWRFLLVFILGFGFTSLYLHYLKVNLSFTEADTYSGVVKELLVTDYQQKAKVRLDSPSKGNLNIYLGVDKRIMVRDRITFTGEVSYPKEDRQGYYLQQKLLGSIYKAEILEREDGKGVLRGLFLIRERIMSTLIFLYPQTKARFVAGILIGKSAGFSNEFLADLQKTGTTHLIALSGYNVTIVISIFLRLIERFFSKKIVFVFAVLGVLAFVVMTGAEASVTRAAIMALLLLYERFFKSYFSFELIVCITALVMILYNPLTLVYDVGFILSFLALLGLVYIYPLFKVSSVGVLAWKENLFSTISAQLAVLPILFSTFETVSLISLVTNVLILSVIPLTMLTGFLSVLISLIYLPLAKVFILATNLLVDYELWVISFFSGFPLEVRVESFHFAIGVGYYLFLIILIYVDKRRSFNS